MENFQKLIIVVVIKNFSAYFQVQLLYYSLIDNNKMCMSNVNFSSVANLYEYFVPIAITSDNTIRTSK